MSQDSRVKPATQANTQISKFPCSVIIYFFELQALAPFKSKEKGHIKQLHNLLIGKSIPKQTPQPQETKTYNSAQIKLLKNVGESSPACNFVT